MSKRKGRTYELEIKALLEDRGCTVIDVASNAGLTGKFDADLLVWRPGHNPKAGWQQRKDPMMIEMEVKYRKSAIGFSQVYDRHLKLCGLGGPDYIHWRDVSTGGIVSFLQSSFSTSMESWEVHENALTKFTKAAFKPGVSVVACRASRNPWLFFWK